MPCSSPLDRGFRDTIVGFDIQPSQTISSGCSKIQTHRREHQIETSIFSPSNTGAPIEHGNENTAQTIKFFVALSRIFNPAGGSTGRDKKSTYKASQTLPHNCLQSRGIPKSRPQKSSNGERRKAAMLTMQSCFKATYRFGW